MNENEKPFFPDTVMESMNPSIQKITRLLNKIETPSKTQKLKEARESVEKNTMK